MDLSGEELRRVGGRLITLPHPFRAAPQLSRKDTPARTLISKVVPSALASNSVSACS